MGWCGSIKIVRTPASNFFSSSGRPKTWKMVFFRVSHIYGTFWSRRPYMGTTMWKLTSCRIGKCDGFPCSDVLNPSYGWAKSTESEILSSSSKIVGVKKKRHGHNFQNFGSILNQRQSNPLLSTLIQYGTEIWKIEAVSFFFNANYFWGQTQNFRLRWLWPAITRVQNIGAWKTITFSKSSGRQLSHGTPHVGSTGS